MSQHVSSKQSFSVEKANAIDAKEHRKYSFSIGKRQRFILSVTILSLSLVLSEYVFNQFGVMFSLLLAVATGIAFSLSMKQKGKESPHMQAYILPFLYSLSFSLFYFLAPSRQLTRIISTTLYAVGLYSVFLSENIFTVASIRTIALLNGARIVSFVISLISYFFLANIIFSLRIDFIPTMILFFISSFLLILHALWTYSLEKPFFRQGALVAMVSVALLELAVMLWFWPTSPTVVALYLTGMFYVFVGLFHVWFDKRLFKGVMLEYLWVAALACIILIVFTSWQG